MMDGTTTTTAPIPATRLTIYPEETAWDWYQRSSSQQRLRRRRRPDWHVGISYVDAAWQHHPTVPSSLLSNVIVLEGPVAKTWTLRSLAARFVLSPPQSQDQDDPSTSSTCTRQLSPKPRVWILDAIGDFHSAWGISALAHVVRSTYVRQSSSSSSSSSREMQHQIIQDAMNRIQIFDASSTTTLVALLQVLQDQQTRDEDPPIPTLLLWDGIEPTNTSQEGADVLRPLQDWLETSSNTSPASSGSLLYVVLAARYASSAALGRMCSLPFKRIRFERRQGKDCVGTVAGQQFPFSLSLGGILS